MGWLISLFFLAPAHATDTHYINPAMPILQGTQLPAQLDYLTLQALHEGVYTGNLVAKQTGQSPETLNADTLTVQLRYQEDGIYAEFTNSQDTTIILENSAGQSCPLTLDKAHALTFVSKNASYANGGSIIEDGRMELAFDFTDRANCRWLSRGELKLAINPSSKQVDSLSFYIPITLVYGPVKYCADLSCPAEYIDTIGFSFSAQKTAN